MKMTWNEWKNKENCHVLVNQFHGKFHSKTIACGEIKYVCFNAPWGLKGLKQRWVQFLDSAGKPRALHIERPDVAYRSVHRFQPAPPCRCNAAAQSRKAVTAYCYSKRLPPFGFAGQNRRQRLQRQEIVSETGFLNVDVNYTKTALHRSVSHFFTLHNVLIYFVFCISCMYMFCS